MNKINIRVADINDLPYIIELMADDELAIKREKFALPLPQCYVEAFNNISNDNNSNLLVACSSDKIIGCLQITLTQYLSHKGGIRATIENVRIASEYRNRGIGTMLMNRAIKIAEEKNCSIVQLTSNSERKDAHRFYRRLGFEPTHIGMKLYL